MRLDRCKANGAKIIRKGAASSDCSAPAQAAHHILSCADSSAAACLNL